MRSPNGIQSDHQSMKICFYFNENRLSVLFVTLIHIVGPIQMSPSDNARQDKSVMELYQPNDSPFSRYFVNDNR